MSFLSIRDLDLSGKRLFIRVDFNVPLEKNAQGEMQITSDKLSTVQKKIQGNQEHNPIS